MVFFVCDRTGNWEHGAAMMIDVGSPLATGGEVPPLTIIERAESAKNSAHYVENLETFPCFSPGRPCTTECHKHTCKSRKAGRKREEREPNELFQERRPRRREANCEKASKTVTLHGNEEKRKVLAWPENRS